MYVEASLDHGPLYPTWGFSKIFITGVAMALQSAALLSGLGIGTQNVWVCAKKTQNIWVSFLGKCKIWVSEPMVFGYCEKYPKSLGISHWVM